MCKLVENCVCILGTIFDTISMKSWIETCYLYYVTIIKVSICIEIILSISIGSSMCELLHLFRLTALEQHDSWANLPKNFETCFAVDWRLQHFGRSNTSNPQWWIGFFPIQLSTSLDREGCECWPSTCDEAGRVGGFNCDFSKLQLAGRTTLLINHC